MGKAKARTRAATPVGTSQAALSLSDAIAVVAGVAAADRNSETAAPPLVAAARSLTRGTIEFSIASTVTCPKCAEAAAIGEALWRGAPHSDNANAAPSWWPALYDALSNQGPAIEVAKALCGMSMPPPPTSSAAAAASDDGNASACDWLACVSLLPSSSTGTASSSTASSTASTSGSRSSGRHATAAQAHIPAAAASPPRFVLHASRYQPFAPSCCGTDGDLSEPHAATAVAARSKQTGAGDADSMTLGAQCLAAVASEAAFDARQGLLPLASGGSATAVLAGAATQVDAVAATRPGVGGGTWVTAVDAALQGTARRGAVAASAVTAAAGASGSSTSSKKKQQQQQQQLALQPSALAGAPVVPAPVAATPFAVLPWAAASCACAAAAAIATAHELSTGERPRDATASAMTLVAVLDAVGIDAFAKREMRRRTAASGAPVEAAQRVALALTYKDEAEAAGALPSFEDAITEFNFNFNPNLMRLLAERALEGGVGPAISGAAAAAATAAFATWHAGNQRRAAEMETVQAAIRGVVALRDARDAFRTAQQAAIAAAAAADTERRDAEGLGLASRGVPLGTDAAVAAAAAAAGRLVAVVTPSAASAAGGAAASSASASATSTAVSAIVATSGALFAAAAEVVPRLLQRMQRDAAASITSNTGSGSVTALSSSLAAHAGRLRALQAADAVLAREAEEAAAVAATAASSPSLSSALATQQLAHVDSRLASVTSMVSRRVSARRARRTHVHRALDFNLVPPPPPPHPG